MVSTPGLYPVHIDGWRVLFPLRNPCSPPPHPKESTCHICFLFVFFFLQRTLSVCLPSATARYTSTAWTCSTMMIPRIFCTLKFCLTMATCWWVSVALQLFKTANFYLGPYMSQLVWSQFGPLTLLHCHIRSPWHLICSLWIKLFCFQYHRVGHASKEKSATLVWIVVCHSE